VEARRARLIGASGLGVRGRGLGRSGDAPGAACVIADHGDVAAPAFGSDATIRIAFDAPAIVAMAAGQAEDQLQHRNAPRVGLAVPCVPEGPSFELGMLVTNQDATERQGHGGQECTEQEQKCRDAEKERERYQYKHRASIDLRRDVSPGCGYVTSGRDRPPIESIELQAKGR